MMTATSSVGIAKKSFGSGINSGRLVTAWPSRFRVHFGSGNGSCPIFYANLLKRLAPPREIPQVSVINRLAESGTFSSPMFSHAYFDDCPTAGHASKRPLLMLCRHLGPVAHSSAAETRTHQSVGLYLKYDTFDIRCDLTSGEIAD